MSTVFALGWGWRLGTRPVEVAVSKLGMNLKADLLTVLLLLGFSLCVVGVFFLYRDYESRLAGLDTELKQVKGQLEGFRTTFREDLESLIRCVEYRLHPTFPEPVRRVCRRGTGPRAFALSSSGWDTFEVGLRLLLRDGSTEELRHQLKF